MVYVCSFVEFSGLKKICHFLGYEEVQTRQATVLSSVYALQPVQMDSHLQALDVLRVVFLSRSSVALEAHSASKQERSSHQTPQWPCPGNRFLSSFRLHPTPSTFSSILIGSLRKERLCGLTSQGEPGVQPSLAASSRSPHSDESGAAEGRGGRGGSREGEKPPQTMVSVLPHSPSVSLSLDGGGCQMRLDISGCSPRS